MLAAIAMFATQRAILEISGWSPRVCRVPGVDGTFFGWFLMAKRHRQSHSFLLFGDSSVGQSKEKKINWMKLHFSDVDYKLRAHLDILLFEARRSIQAATLIRAHTHSHRSTLSILYHFVLRCKYAYRDVYLRIWKKGARNCWVDMHIGYSRSIPYST